MAVSHRSIVASDCEDEELTSVSAGNENTTAADTPSAVEPACYGRTEVMVWGLNDKDQLGGLRGSKIKVPTRNEHLSALHCVQITGGSKSLFAVTQSGRVYACGDSSSGRLGLGPNVSGNVSVPKAVPGLTGVKKVAVHSGGRHALALTYDGRVFSWGDGDDGKLGHNSRMNLDAPRLVTALRFANTRKRVVEVACGSSHSAAITNNGELYTWGLGDYGRLGHGDVKTQLRPKRVQALKTYRVTQVACGSRDAQTLAVTDDGTMWSWGDGDFGKLGRGGSEGCNVPHPVDRLQDMGVVQIECGAQFSLALTRDGRVWTWGKGDYCRLGHGTEAHVRKPQPVEGLQGVRVVHVAVGALHCLAVTDEGQVYAWGDNDHGQEGNGNTGMFNTRPSLVLGLDKLKIARVGCGSSHCCAWTAPNHWDQEASRRFEAVRFGTPTDILGAQQTGESYM